MLVPATVAEYAGAAQNVLEFLNAVMMKRNPGSSSLKHNDTDTEIFTRRTATAK